MVGNIVISIITPRKEKDGRVQKFKNIAKNRVGYIQQCKTYSYKKKTSRYYGTS